MDMEHLTMNLVRWARDLNYSPREINGPTYNP